MTGFTQLPNWLIEAMPQMPASTFQIAIVIARQTIGYSDGNGGRKEWDRISLSQFERATGLSNLGVRKAITQGIGKWFARREKGQSFEYQLCNSVTQSDSVTMQLSNIEPCNSVTQSDPKLCNSVTPQKKEIQTKKERSSPPAASDDDGGAAKGLIAELQTRQFVYLDREPKRLADNLLADFGLADCMAALERTAAAHKKQISSGERGILAPLAYMRSILPINGNGKPREKVLRGLIDANGNPIIDESTGKQRMVLA